jgi:hypothetical protein
MNTKTLLMFAAIAAVLGTVGILTIQPASATSYFNQQSDQGNCMFSCNNQQNLQANFQRTENGNNDNDQNQNNSFEN